MQYHYIRSYASTAVLALALGSYIISLDVRIGGIADDHSILSVLDAMILLMVNDWNGLVIIQPDSNSAR